MTILIHVLIAIASIGCTTFVFLFPSESRLKVSYGFIAATFISGTYLVVSKQAALLPTCETGLIYLGVMTVALLAARYRLSAQKVRAGKQD